MMGKFSNYISKRFPMGIFAKHVATLMTGTVLAASIGVMVMPVLTRLYGPEDFGTFALYTSILGILTVVTCWRYELAVVLPEKDEDAANLLMLCVIICLGMGLLTLILVTLCRTYVANLLSSLTLAFWLWFLPLSVIAAGLFRALNYWSTRRKHFKRLAARQITQSGVTAFTQIGTGLLYPSFNAGGLIGGSIIGHLVATGRLAWQIKSDEGTFIRNSIGRPNLFRVFRRYKNFPLFDVWSGLLNTASTMLPALLLGYYFNPSIVGFYALGHQVLAVPMGIVGSAVAQVFYPRANEAKLDGHLSQLTLKIFDRLLKIGFVPFLLLTIVAPELFAFIFGAPWVTAGEFVRWLSVWLLFVFISSPLSNIYSIMEKQKEGLIVNIVMFGTRLLVIVIGGIKGDAYFTIALFGITGAVLWSFNCIYIQHLAGIPVRNVFKVILQQFLYGIPYITIPIIMYYITNNSLAFVLAGIGAGAIFLIVQVISIKKIGRFA